MRLVSAYVNGSTVGTPPGKNDHERAKRGEVKGWSAAAVRRHTKWLYSIDSEQLAGRDGFAVTLTVRDCPPDSAAFADLRRRWIARMERAGVDLLHWVTEWQRRGVPHVHSALYGAARAPGDVPVGSLPSCPPAPSESRTRAFEVPEAAAAGGARRSRDLAAAAAGIAALPGMPLGLLAVLAWCDLAAEYGAEFGAQHWDRIDGPVGWLKYLSKHAARGVAHYQRQGMPPGWEKSGRLWGRRGDWPEIEPMRFAMDDRAYFRYRRMMRSWRVADARSESDPTIRRRRIASARRMLECSDRALSPVRGVSEWAGESVTLGLLGLLHDQGHTIIQREDLPA